MRTLLTTITFTCATLAIAQKPIADHVARLRHGSVEQVAVQPFREVSTPADKRLSNVLADATIAELDRGTIDRITDDRPPFIRLSVPFRNGTVALDLFRFDPIGEGFTVRTEKGLHSGYERGVYYRGIIANDPRSIAAFSFFTDQIIGMASSPGAGNIVVERMTGNSKAHHVIFANRDMLVEAPLLCSMPDVKAVSEPERPSDGNERTVNCVRLYYEVGFSAFGMNDSDVEQSVNWATAAHNNVSTLFANDGVSVALSEVFVWTQQEAFLLNYDQFDVDAFASYRTAFNGDVATFISAQAGAGFARGVGGICAAGAYDTSPVYVYEDVPTFNWMVPAITHEIGHVCGSPHTHQCVWNGNNTQIDDCGNVDPFGSTPEGAACFDTQNPILPPDGMGTIMSYCGLDIAQGFGPQPAQRIRDHINAAACLGTDCVHSCTPSVTNMTVSDITPYSALLNFEDLNPNVTEWQVQVMDDSQIMIDWTTITTTSFPITGLWQGHLYQVRLRSACPDPWSNDFIFLREFTPTTTTCGQHVYDAGGTGPYAGNETHTYYPDVEGNAVSITFVGFWLEQDGDFLTIHNGPTTNSPVLGSFTGWTTPPGIFTSTDPSGALTIALAVDDPNEFQPNDGWDILLSCAPAVNTGIPEGALKNGSFTAYLDPATGLLSVRFTLSQSAEVSLELVDPQGRLIRVPISSSHRVVGDHQVTLPMPDLAFGCYLLALHLDGQGHAIRLVK